MSIPSGLQPFADRLVEIMSREDAERVIETMVTTKRTGWWRNTLLSVERASQPAGTPIEGLKGCFSVSGEDRQALLQHPAVSAGAVYPINPASVLAARALRAQAHEEVLDLAAAPGGKTLILAADMRNTGRIAAVEPVKGRFHRLRANMDRCGVQNVQFYLSDGRGIGRKVPGRFDRVLLDAPCSSESRIRLDEPGSYAHWTLRKIKETARKQKTLIRSAFTALKPGGRLIYCTCAFAPEENEMIVNALLEAEPAADLEDIRSSAPGYRQGLTKWRTKSLDERLTRAVRILPDDLWDGFFLCRIIRRE